jgi:hypothetical protein
VLERARSAGDPIDAFSNSWRAFNNLFFGNGNEPEREKIKRYLRDKVDEEAARRLLASHPEQINYLLSQPVVDMRDNGRDTASNIESFKRANTSRAKLEELFMVIYQVRCNLEHGQKSPNLERDLLLCGNSAPIVAAVVQHDA